MAIALDGFDALHRIGVARRLFAPARIEADKAARAIVAKSLKAKTLDLDALRAIGKALGDDTFALIVHDLKAAETLALAKRVDGHNADLKSMTVPQRASHLMALARGAIQPIPVSPERKTAAGKSRAPKRIESALMTAFAKGRRADD